MTAPRVPRWPLTPALLLGGLALAFALGSQVAEGWLPGVLWLAAVVLLVLAAFQLAKNWPRQR
jgi:hypothetical protein